MMIKNQNLSYVSTRFGVVFFSYFIQHLTTQLKAAQSQVKVMEETQGLHPVTEADLT